MSTWECVSCGATGQEKVYCEACGAAQPIDGVDTALSLVIGRVCTTCDAYNDPGVDVCASCGTPIADEGAPPEAPAAPPPPEAPSVPPPAVSAAPSGLAGDLQSPPSTGPSWMTPPSGQPLPTAFALPKADLADLKRAAQGLTAPATPAQVAPPPTPDDNAPTAPTLCSKCKTALTPSDRFCRNCGTRVGDAPAPAAPVHTTQMPAARLGSLPSPVLGTGVGATAMMPAFRSVGLDPGGERTSSAPSMTMVFGAVSAERSAKLVLVRGQSSFGTQWRLQAGETVLGRSDGTILFPDDATLAARHAVLRFEGHELVLDPLPSTNGVFVRIKEPTRLQPGDELVLGAQRLIVLAESDRPASGVAPEAGTRTLGSLVKPQPPISLLRVCSEGAGHEVYHRHQRLLTLGRTHCDVNFARDSFVSERHAQLSRMDDGALVVEDLRSRNGTYLRARGRMRLAHGDLLLLSDKVLRVELPQR